MTEDVASAAALVGLGFALWLPLGLALALGRVRMSAQECSALAKRALGFGLLALPLAWLVFFGLASLSQAREPLVRMGFTGLLALLTFPLYGAFILTSVFETSSKARDLSARRPLLIRLLSGLAILAVNLLAAMLLVFFAAASAGTYRGWN